MGTPAASTLNAERSKISAALKVRPLTPSCLSPGHEGFCYGRCHIRQGFGVLVFLFDKLYESVEKGMHLFDIARGSCSFTSRLVPFAGELFEGYRINPFPCADLMEFLDVF